MVLAAMLDKVTRAYDLESKHPAIKYVGHEEVVRGIDYLPEKGLYITGELLSHHIAPSPKQQGVVWPIPWPRFCAQHKESVHLCCTA